MNPLIQFRKSIALCLIVLVLACFAISPMARAVIPAPDGGYPVGNTAEGEDALFSLTTGIYNTAIGFSALYNNTTGYYNTANGEEALYSNIQGRNNTANGLQALYSNINGSNNTANGFQALYSNTTGSNNTAFGVDALLHNAGSGNVGLGTDAGKNLTTGSGNVCIGVNVLGVAGESNTTRIRNVYSSVASGRAVYVNSDNKIGTLASTRRVKNDIKPMDKASEAVLALKPVSFRYKKEIDASGTLQFGLVAEEVADINADLVTRDSENKPETVRYEAVNAMLLNEFLKEHRTVQELKSNAAKQEATIAKQQKQIEALTAGLQKVSAQIEASKPAPQVVNNP
jgi:trimeric autotransporter adhesin